MIYLWSEFIIICPADLICTSYKTCLICSISQIHRLLPKVNGLHRTVNVQMGLLDLRNVAERECWSGELRLRTRLICWGRLWRSVNAPKSEFTHKFMHIWLSNLVSSVLPKEFYQIAERFGLPVQLKVDLSRIAENLSEPGVLVRSQDLSLHIKVALLNSDVYYVRFWAWFLLTYQWLILFW